MKDTTDDVWQLTMQLKDIVEMIRAQNISVPQVAYLDVLIQEYLESRKALFPESNLKPKHHYLCHYPALTLKFGPLISYGQCASKASTVTSKDVQGI